MKEDRKSLTDFTIKPVTKTVKEATEKELSKYEEDNTGLQAVHAAEQSGSSAYQMGKRTFEVRQHKKGNHHSRATRSSGG